jgi:phosphonate transport system ATP-binding protein
MLEILNLEKRYNTGDHALKGVTVTIPEGQVVGLIGPSGAGKSTLIRCINRLVDSTAGDIRLDGQSIPALNRAKLRSLRRRIGMIFQEHALIERLSVMENLLAGRLGYVGFWPAWFRRFPAEDIRRALDLLDRVGLADHRDKRADALSGGQRQRVGIARALMQSPQMLLVDEPTASLDPKTSRDIMRLITRLANEENITAIVNSHDVPLARQFSDRILGLRKGELIFDGTPADLTDATLTDIYGAEDWNDTPDPSEHGAAPLSPEHIVQAL